MVLVLLVVMVLFEVLDNNATQEYPADPVDQKLLINKNLNREQTWCSQGCSTNTVVIH